MDTNMHDSDNMNDQPFDELVKVTAADMDDSDDEVMIDSDVDSIGEYFDSEPKPAVDSDTESVIEYFNPEPEAVNDSDSDIHGETDGGDGQPDDNDPMSLFQIPVCIERKPTAKYIRADSFSPRSCSPDLIMEARSQKAIEMADRAHEKRAPDNTTAVARLTSAQREHKLLHEKALAVKSGKMPAERVHWVGIVNPSIKASNIRVDADFFWMRGRPKSTVRTVLEFYKQSVGGSAELQLQIHGEIPKWTDTLRELDFFNDQYAIFRPIFVHSTIIE